AEVIYTDGSFIIATSFMDLVNKIWDAASKIDQEVWTFRHAFHQFKKRAVIFKITIGHQAHCVQVWRKNIGIFINRPVLDHVFIFLADFKNLAKATVQKVDLEVKGPAF